jgi:VanZ family protein
VALAPLPRRSGGMVAVWGLALVLAATLYPFDFSYVEQVSVVDDFSLARVMKPRGNDLFIGADAAFAQGFRGTIAELRIYRDALTSVDVTREAEWSPDTPKRLRTVAASYSFAESSRAVLRDNSGNSNHGKLVGDPIWIKNNGHGALRFNGSGQHVRVPNSPSIDIGGRNITISMRVMLEDGPSDGVIVSKPWWPGVMAPPYHQYAVEFGTLERSVNFYFADAKGRQRGPFGVQPPIGVWTHIVFVYDGAVKGYVDGREVPVSNADEPWDLADILGNLLLFVPLGFGLAAMAESRGLPHVYTIPLILVLSAALSLGVEVLQCWLPDRDPSWVDVATNSASSVLGAALHFAASYEILERLKRLILDRSRPRDNA